MVKVYSWCMLVWSYSSGITLCTAKKGIGQVMSQVIMSLILIREPFKNNLETDQ